MVPSKSDSGVSVVWLELGNEIVVDLSSVSAFVFAALLLSENSSFFCVDNGLSAVDASGPSRRSGLLVSVEVEMMENWLWLETVEVRAGAGNTDQAGCTPWL